MAKPKVEDFKNTETFIKAFCAWYLEDNKTKPYEKPLPSRQRNMTAYYLRGI